MVTNFNSIILSDQYGMPGEHLIILAQGISVMLNGIKFLRLGNRIYSKHGGKTTQYISMQHPEDLVGVVMEPDKIQLILQAHLTRLLYVDGQMISGSSRI